MSEEKLLYLLQKKRGFFEAILELTEIEENLPLEELIPSLEQKKILLSCIEEIDYQLEPFQKSMHNLSLEIDEELHMICKVIEHILHLDKVHQEKRKKELDMPKKARYGSLKRELA